MFPVIIRELQAEARHPFTYWMRILGAGAMLLAVAFPGSQRGFSITPGGLLFERLHFTLFCSIWLLVPLVTADCISRERREGTLGLLFLTPLTARNIVLAKAFAHGLRAMTLCLAVLPVLAIPFLMGGVSWQEAALSVMTNFSAFCLALAAGLLASSSTKVWLRSLLYAMAISLLFTLCFSLLNFFTTLSVYRVYNPASFRRPVQWEVLLYQSVAFAANTYGVWRDLFARVSPSGRTALLLVAVGMGGLSLAGLAMAIQLAATNVRRRWQEEPPSARRLWWQRTFCTPVLWLKFFRGWMRWKLDHNPIGWLQQRTWTARVITWSWFALIGCLSTGALRYVDLFRHDFFTVQSLLAWFLVGSMGVSAAGSFQRERETRVLELLLVSPLSVGQIVTGRLRGLWGQFLPSILMLLGVWLYFAHLFSETARAEWVWFFAWTFFTLPVIGLYYSLRRAHFISSLLWTGSVGVAIPLFLMALNDRFEAIGAAITLVLAVVLFSGFLVMTIYCFDRYFNWTTSIVCSVGISLLIIYAICVALNFMQPWMGFDPIRAVFHFVEEMRIFFIASAIQLIVAAGLGFKLHRTLLRRNFAFQQGGD